MTDEEEGRFKIAEHRLHMAIKTLENRLVSALSALDQAEKHKAAQQAVSSERDQLQQALAEKQTAIADLRQALAAQERRVGELQTENAALKRVQDLMGQKLDGAIAALEQQLEEA